VSYAFGYSGTSQIQLIQQHDDLPSIYRDAYPDGDFGFHHVARLVVDYQTERQKLVDAGVELACELWANDIVACYFDTRATLGAMTELHIHTDRIAATFERWRHAHLAWDGTGSPLGTHVSGT
jgi:Glyoxalase/Bleomycin resistance protein/Dioxygenase superfamily